MIFFFNRTARIRRERKRLKIQARVPDTTTHYLRQSLLAIQIIRDARLSRILSDKC